MGKTSIQWTDRSINPIRAMNTATGDIGHYCERIATGCANCYASRMQQRFEMPAYPGHGKRPPGIEPLFDATKLQEVLRRKKPTKLFWCDMTDLFGEWVPEWWIDQCFATMAATPQHTHQVLTKRPERMAAYLLSSGRYAGNEVSRQFMVAVTGGNMMEDGDTAVDAIHGYGWPLPNVWLGMSASTQADLDAGLPHLLKCPAAVRFLSLEPLLEEITLRFYAERCQHCNKSTAGHAVGLRNDTSQPFQWFCNRTTCGDQYALPGVDFVIVGGESGPRARPCNVEWIRSIVEQSKEADVPCFMKQLGARIVVANDSAAEWPRQGDEWIALDPHYQPHHQGEPLEIRLADPKGGDPDEWPADLRVREFPKQ